MLMALVSRETQQNYILTTISHMPVIRYGVSLKKTTVKILLLLINKLYIEDML